MSNKKTVTVTYASSDPAKPTFAPGGTTDLNKGDTITVHLAGNFPDNSKINKVIIYNNKVVNGVDTKDWDSVVGSWTADHGNDSGLDNKFKCSADSSTTIKIEDIEDSDDDVKYWYSAFGPVGGTTTTWKIDPELINKGKPGATIYVEPRTQERVES